MRFVSFRQNGIDGLATRFGDGSWGGLLASHAAVALSSARHDADLHEALATRQHIGEATGLWRPVSSHPVVLAMAVKRLQYNSVFTSAAELRTAMIDGRPIDRAQHPVGHVGGPRNLQEVTAGGKCHGWLLLSRPAWLALGQERFHALAKIRARVVAHHELVPASRRGPVADDAIEGFLRGSKRERRVLEERARQLGGAPVEVVVPLIKAPELDGLIVACKAANGNGNDEVSVSILIFTADTSASLHQQEIVTLLPSYGSISKP